MSVGGTLITSEDEEDEDEDVVGAGAGGGLAGRLKDLLLLGFCCSLGLLVGFVVVCLVAAGLTVVC